jgi:FKBP-type peptidyl-prolyl cis-trans isomerase
MLLRLRLCLAPALACLLAIQPLSAADRPAVDYLPPRDAALVDAQMPGARLLPGGIRFLELKPGEGPPIRKGDRVNALYIGRLLDGSIFNQKRSRFHSYRFEVGAQPRQVIRGWEVALLLMQTGGTYQVAIPSEFAYRDYGRPGQVPPHATVIFEIEILEVARRAE